VSKKIKLRGVRVQPLISLEDEDGYLEDIDEPVSEIPAREWPTYSSEEFPRQMAESQAKLDEAE
jgi:hypothetical protein